MGAYYWSIVLVVIGILILLLELFVPSAGILGIASVILLVAGIVIGFSVNFSLGVALMVCTLLGVLLLFALMVKVWPHTPLGRGILITPVDSPDDVLPDAEYLNEIRQSIGKLGRAETKMLPSGTVMIDGQTFDALSDGLPIEQGQAIKVVAVKGNRIIVEPYSGEVDGDLPAADSDMLSQPIEDLGIDGLDDPLG